MPRVELTRGMDIVAYLDKQKKHLGQRSSDIRDFSVFDYNHIPNQPVMREEAKCLIDEILRFQ